MILWWDSHVYDVKIEDTRIKLEYDEEDILLDDSLFHLRVTLIILNHIKDCLYWNVINWQIRLSDSL